MNIVIKQITIPSINKNIASLANRNEHFFEYDQKMGLLLHLCQHVRNEIRS